MTKHLLLASLLAAGLSTTGEASAASDDECAIWICLPASFISGSNCGDAYDAMVDRLKNLEPPLPPYGSCVNGTPDPRYRMTARDGIATYYDGAYHQGEYCHLRRDEWIPNGCDGRNYWYVEVYGASGQQQGQTQYIPR